MTNFWPLVVSNAIGATALALVVAVVTRYWRNPHLGHALWLLVLVKLVAPPLLRLPVIIPLVAPRAIELAVPSDRGSADNTATLETASQLAANARGTTPGSALEPRDRAPRADDRAATIAASAAARSELGYPAKYPWWYRAVVLSALSSARGVAPWLLLAWAVGTLVWTALFASRVVRFHRIVRKAPRADDPLQAELAALAAQVQLKRWPELRIVECAIAPLLWGVGDRPTIVLPRKLLARLDVVGRRALLAHELAHYVRRDHWVRWLEMLVLALWFWHPVVWWARRRVQGAQEQCCDAWAIWLTEGDRRAYGLTLLVAIEFLAAAGRRAPLAASGMANSFDLKRRFQMISHGSFARRITWRVRLAIATVALVVLPVSVLCVMAGPPNHDWARLSPFTEVRLRGEDAADVELEGVFYKLVSINDVSTADLLDAACKHYGELWQKRFIEDLVEVMEQVGPRPGDTVKLVLRDLSTGQDKVIDKAPMTSANRQKAYMARNLVPSDTPGTVPAAREWERIRLGRLAAGLDVEQQIHELVASFVGAAHRNDADTIASLRAPMKIAGGPTPQQIAVQDIKNMQTIESEGGKPTEIRTIIAVADDHVLAITDFFNRHVTEAEHTGMYCLVYECQLEGERWLIADIDVETVEGLVGEVGRQVARFVRNAKPRTPRDADAGSR